jgi:hypothetical protein
MLKITFYPDNRASISGRYHDEKGNTCLENDATLTHEQASELITQFRSESAEGRVDASVCVIGNATEKQFSSLSPNWIFGDPAGYKDLTTPLILS